MVSRSRSGLLVRLVAIASGVCAVATLPCPARAAAEAGPPARLRDRGVGTPTSMFGIYVAGGELLVYPFFEYYRDHDAEYSPEELGYGLDQDFRGRYRATEGLIFIGYGLTDALALELEAAVIDATLRTASDDTTDVPDEVSESGLGDVQTQFDWTWLHETESRPELFSYLEIVYPLNKTKKLIGTADWEYKFGTGAVRGFAWGTMSLRAAAEYSAEESKVEVGEVAIECLRRVSSAWKLYAGVEGAQDEVELITEAQWSVAPRVVVKLNSAFGLTSKATDWAPEIGVLFRF